MPTRAEDAAPIDPGRIFGPLLDSLRLIVFVKDLSGRYLYVNKRCEQLSGLPASLLVGKTDFDLFPSEVAGRMRSQDAEIVANGEPVEFEETLAFPAGMLSFITEKFPLRGAGGRIWAVGAICTDTTLQNRRAEESLAIERERARVALHAIRDAVLSTDVDGVVLMLNPAAESILGRKNAEAVGRPLDEVLRVSGPSKALRLARLLGEGAPGARETRDFQSADGSIRRGSVSAAPVRDRGGRTIGSVVSLRDMTELEAANAALEAALKETRTIMKAIPDIFYRLDAEMKMAEWNSVLEDVSGYSPGELRGMHALDFFRQDKEVIADGIREAVAKGQAFREGRFLTRRGEEIPYFWSAAALRSDDGGLLGLVGVGRDVAARNRAERNLLTMQKLDSVGVLAGGIAHDFNNILTAILGNLSLLQSGMEPGSEALELVREAQDACGTAKNLSNQLLTFSEGGSPVLKVLDLRPLLTQVAGFSARGSNSRCVFDLGESPLAATVDKDQIAQVIQNLVLNAAQAMPEGGVIKVRASAVAVGENELPPLAAGRYVRVSVADEGCGIPTEDLSKIFDPYFSTKSGGRGLGLSVCYSIVAKHGGRISVDSNPGRGSVMTLHFPAANAADIPRDEESFAVAMGAGRVLVVDDEAVVVKLLNRLLKRLGYDAATFSDGQAALDEYEKTMKGGRPYDAVIIDLTIPGGMGGKEMVRKLMALDPGAKAIVSSGYSSDPVLAEYAAHGFCGVLAKPYGIEELSAALRRAIGSAPSR
ncbi:MAG: PAS domain-containing protein [Elusimicrobiota bacterium]